MEPYSKLPELKKENKALRGLKIQWQETSVKTEALRWGVTSFPTSIGLVSRPLAIQEVLMRESNRIGLQDPGLEKEHREFFKKILPAIQADTQEGGVTESNMVDDTVNTPSLESTSKVRQRIREWAKLEVFPGQPFNVRDAYPIVNAREPEEKRVVAKELNYLIDKGILEHPIGAAYGNYKRIDDTKVIVDFKNATTENFDIELPFDLSKIITLSPSDLIVVAGESGAGKTSFALELIKRNLGLHKCLYLSSELTAGKMKKRLLLHEDIDFDKWDFNMEIREHDFSNAIDPDRVSIVDFIVTTDDFWKAAIALREIHNKMINGKGLCFAFLQKGAEKEFGYGGDLTQQHASLYLTISKMNSKHPNYLKFVKVREFKDDIESPLGKVIPFKLFNSWKFKPLVGSPIYQDDYNGVSKVKKPWEQ